MIWGWGHDPEPTDELLTKGAAMSTEGNGPSTEPVDDTVVDLPEADLSGDPVGDYDHGDIPDELLAEADTTDPDST